MNRVVRVLAVAVAAALSVTCADKATNTRGARYARIPLAPSFANAPPGGPSITIDHIIGVLHGPTDSSVANAQVEGDSAILEFENVVVHGDSQTFQLGLKAYDANNVVVFDGEQSISVKPGENKPATPTLDYVAPDANAASIEIAQPSGVSVVALTLDWAGSDPANVSCLVRETRVNRVIGDTLTVTGKTAANAPVTAIRVGWTSRDTTVFTVDGTGIVQSRCANKSAYLVARTFLDVVDSVSVSVNAPPFTLRMSPDSASVQRGKKQQLVAEVVDEVGNVIQAASVRWHSSDTTRAKVDSITGLVTAIANGRVLITATSNGRTTVGVIQVRRPDAFKVIVLPSTASENIGIGQSKAYYAKALDSLNRIIPDAAGFTWSTNAAASVFALDSATGLAKAVGTGSGFVKVKLDNKRDSVTLVVLDSLPGGGIQGRITDASSPTSAPIQGATVQSSVSNTTTTDVNGVFVLNNLHDGNNITVTKSGFASITAYAVPAFPGLTLEVPSIGMSPTGANSSFSGKVVSAISGNAVSGVKVRAYTGVNGGPTPYRPAVAAIDSATTAADGSFSFTNKAVGVYTLLFSANGYSDAIGGANSVAGTNKVISDVLMAPSAVSSGLYILLTWGDCTVPANNVPCDLDAHLTGPKSTPDTGRFQVSRNVLMYAQSPDTIAALDLEDANNRGPEIISLRPAAAVGLYHFYVHNYSGRAATGGKALSDSSKARVDVYQDGRLIGTFFPPTNTVGTLWNVFDYDGARLTPVGTITNPANVNTPALALRAWDFPADVGLKSLQVRPLALPGAARR